MNILEQIYDITLNKIVFHERKITITNNKTILIGPPKSGKTYLIYDYLSKFETEQYLYIDFADYKNNSLEIQKYLYDFVEEHNIDTLVLESFNFDFELPDIQNIIISTYTQNTISDFEILYVTPLDFEEFLLFDTKHQNVSYSFNSFLKYGNFPEIIEYSEPKKVTRNYEICKLFCTDKTDEEILFLLIKNSSEKKSIFQLYNTLKKDIKISKDRFYKTCEYYEKNNIIFYCEKYNQPKAVKKIFLYNHALIDIVSYKKNFNNLFKNMVFLELHRRYEKIYYLDNIDFYLPNENTIVLAISFFNNLVSSSIVSKIIPMVEQYNIQNIDIVTVSSEENFYIGEIQTQVSPFYSWVLTL